MLHMKQDVWRFSATNADKHYMFEKLRWHLENISEHGHYQLFHEEEGDIKIVSRGT